MLQRFFIQFHLPKGPKLERYADKIREIVAGGNAIGTGGAIDPPQQAGSNLEGTTLTMGVKNHHLYNCLAFNYNESMIFSI